MRVRFEDLVFDTERRELARRGCPVRLSPRAFDLLAFLIDRRPEAVSSRELYDHLWPETFVQPANLHNIIAEIRVAIDDRSKSKLQTRHRFGYAFVAQADDDPGKGPAPFHLRMGDRQFDLYPGTNVIGREAAGASVPIFSPLVSRRHAAIRIAGKGATLEDLESKNGTFIGRRRVTSPSSIESGDEIFLGTVRLLFLSGSGTASTVTARSGPVESPRSREDGDE